MHKRILGCITVIFAVLALLLIFVPANAAEFTADWINTKQGVTNQGKVYVKDDRICIEVLDGPEVGIIVADLGKRFSIVMLPDEKIYVEMPKNLSILEPDKDMIMEASKKSMGTETINGRTCDKYQYFAAGTNTAAITQWIDRNLQYPVKIIYHGEGGNAAELKNIRKGPVNEGIFKVRPGYTKKKVEKAGKLTRTRAVEKTTAGKLELSNIVFCSTRPKGHMEYNEQPKATYKPGNTAWIYMNLDGVSHNPNPNGTKEVWIKLHLRVKAPNGDVLLDQNLINEHKNFQKKFNPDEMFLRVNLNTVRGMAEGRYIVELDLKDNLDGRIASASTIFTLKK
jgi:hypothetical protein